MTVPSTGPGGPAPEGWDDRIWRAAGAPLVAGSGRGPLTGEFVAVKDLFDIAGIPVGAGNPAYLAAAGPAVSTAPALSALLVAGADVRGITRLDEFAYGLAGVNQHLRHPPQPGGALPCARWLDQRLGDRGLGGPGEHRIGHRYCWVDPDPGGLPGSVRDPDDPWRGEPGGTAAAGSELRHGRVVDP